MSNCYRKTQGDEGRNVDIESNVAQQDAHQESSWATDQADNSFMSNLPGNNMIGFPM